MQVYLFVIQAYWFVRIDMPFLQIINQTLYKYGQKQNSWFNGPIKSVLCWSSYWVIIGACFSVNAYKGKNNKAEKKIKAYEEYYKCTETLLDSLDGTHNLDLMDTDLETDYGVDYLNAKSKVDELIVK